MEGKIDKALDFFKPKNKIFYANFLIGLLCIVFSQLSPFTDGNEGQLNQAFDHAIVKEAGEAARASESLSSDSENAGQDLVFMEIDSHLHKKWGSPLITPRDKVALVIEAACAGGASIIIPDILFDHRDTGNPAGDLKLEKVLQAVGRGGNATKIILPAKIENDGSLVAPYFSAALSINPNIFFATPMASESSTDNVVRYWSPYKVSTSGERTTFLWNAAFLAALLDGGKASELTQMRNSILGTGNLEDIQLPGKHIKLSSKEDAFYLYRLRFKLIPANTMTNHPQGNLFQNLHSVEEISQVNFKNKIVIIGHSSPEVGDIYPTPVGQMAGMFIIGNAINTILHQHQPHQLPWYCSLFLKVLTVWLACCLLAKKRAVIPVVLMGIVLKLFQYKLTTLIFLNLGLFGNLLATIQTVGNVELFFNTLEHIFGMLEDRKKKQAPRDTGADKARDPVPPRPEVL
jgi:CHASE2 domain-containing sensor protein